MTQAYTTKQGSTQYMPSIEQCEQMEEDNEGWCLNCGEPVDGVEPDAVRYACECCGMKKVYGAMELLLMGLTH